MDGPTLTPSYNALIQFWNSIGEPMPPECEVCGKDVSGMNVVETSMGFVCIDCDTTYLLNEKVFPDESPSRTS